MMDFLSNHPVLTVIIVLVVFLVIRSHIINERCKEYKSIFRMFLKSGSAVFTAGPAFDALVKFGRSIKSDPALGVDVTGAFANYSKSIDTKMMAPVADVITAAHQAIAIYLKHAPKDEIEAGATLIQMAKETAKCPY